MEQNISPKKHSYKTGLVIVGAISLISNIVLLSFDSLAKKLSLDFRFDDFSNDSEELISFAFSILIIVLIVILKDKCKILFSVAACSLTNEFAKLVFAVKNYDLQSYDYTSNSTLLTLFAAAVLFVMSCLVLKRKVDFDKIKMCGILALVAYLGVCVLPVVFFDSLVNISTIIYYFSIYIMFILLAKNII